jgi:CHASE3 domain sensor protein
MTLKWDVGTKIGVGFGLALVIFLFVGAISYRSTTQLTETAALVAHTHRVLETLEAVLSDMKDAETGQRGYLLTGQERYLEPFRAARATTQQDLKMLRELTADNVNQQQRLDLLDPLVEGRDGKFAELQATIDARQDKARGFSAALEIVMTDKGKKVMDDIRTTIGAMRIDANALLKMRTEEAQASARVTMLTIVVGTLAASTVLLVIGFLIRRNIVSPLVEIAATAERIAAGDLGGTIAKSAC